MGDKAGQEQTSDKINQKQITEPHLYVFTLEIGPRKIHITIGLVGNSHYHHFQGRRKQWKNFPILNWFHINCFEIGSELYQLINERKNRREPDLASEEAGGGICLIFGNKFGE